MIYSQPLQSITSKSSINTSSAAIYALINGGGEKARPVPVNRLPLFCATEDVATAHRKVIEVEEEEKVRGKRVNNFFSSLSSDRSSKIL